MRTTGDGFEQNLPTKWLRLVLVEPKLYLWEWVWLVVSRTVIMCDSRRLLFVNVDRRFFIRCAWLSFLCHWQSEAWTWWIFDESPDGTPSVYLRFISKPWKFSWFDLRVCHVFCGFACSLWRTWTVLWKYGKPESPVTGKYMYTVTSCLIISEDGLRTPGRRRLTPVRFFFFPLFFLEKAYWLSIDKAFFTLRPKTYTNTR